jgi:hypothetical protein
MQLPPLDKEGLEVVRCFNRANEPKGVILLEVNNPVPLLVASRIGWFMEGALEFYTPWAPVNPDYLKVQATYLAWVSLHLNLSISAVIKAVQPDIREGANRIIHEVFNQFGGSGGVQSGAFNPSTGATQMGDRVPFLVVNDGPPSVDLKFTPFDRSRITHQEEELAFLMDKLIKTFGENQKGEDHSQCGFYSTDEKKPGNRWDGRKE